MCRDTHIKIKASLRSIVQAFRGSGEVVINVKIRLQGLVVWKFIAIFGEILRII